MKAAVIIPAGGIGNRMGLEYPKQFCLLASIPLLVHTVRSFAKVAAIEQVVLVAPASHLEETSRLAREHNLQTRAIVAGGASRQDSVAAGLAAIHGEPDVILVHDGARPLVTPAIIEGCLAEISRHGAAIAAIPVKDTLKEGVDGLISRTIDRSRLWQAQTPQGARTDLLRQAFAQARADNFSGTDEASLLEHSNIAVALAPGSEENIKITRPEDLAVAEAILMQRHPQTAAVRIGHGYDAHRLVAGRDLVLGGVTVPHSLGLAGHSDADVLTHALCDALLGAMGQGDIGRHFPDNDQRYKNICSLELLEAVIALLHGQHFRLINADLTVIAQRPRLAPHLAAMRENLARVCATETFAINIKATTTEQMGFAGREEGIAAHAVVLIGKG